MTYIVPIILAAILLIAVYHLLTKDRKKRKQFRKEWKTATFSRPEEATSSVVSYWENKKRGTVYDGVDALTWADLSMDEVFKKMNYTQTSVGSEYLLNQLRDIQLTQDRLEEDEKLYREMENNDELRERLLLILSKLGKGDYTDSSAFFYGEHTKGLKNPSVFCVLSLLPVASIVLMFFQLQVGLLCLFTAFIINGVMYYRHKKLLEYGLHSVGYVAGIIHTANKAAAVNESSLLAETDRLKTNLKPLKKILFLNNFVSMGTKGGGDFDAIFEYIRILFLLDFVTYNQIIGTVTKHKENYRVVWEVLGRIDAAIAVAFYRHTLPVYCTPTFTFTEAKKISFLNMAHPLIDEPVRNSANLSSNTLITGSNASGKSTFIKAVAINAILAQTIHTTLAEKWSMPPSYVATSMAVQDNVLAGDSYFIAEIKSLKRIIRMLEEDKPCLSFIDELLKGTNTVERIAASAAMMEWLSTGNGMNITATHDFELTEIMKGTYDNYHFTETFEDGDIHFDYTIHSGPSNSRNAIKLLELLAYPSDMTERANTLAEDFMAEREWRALLRG
ncbi:hypothetical protein H9649_11285 [Sporosarcina sp. Sa2YVA2]|uniref:DNA mismatch repair proteins mutS family domain-containing protein n=1 Tax=Sporosarcina quadrami TaxID=2762234 RepID=A0ABR8UAW4_9BACL|nr:hypothetical protein [Sporosarcina quadrami]MBD7985173.1 hypothetical protein [Sporosarcina quadrami]